MSHRVAYKLINHINQGVILFFSLKLFIGVLDAASNKLRRSKKLRRSNKLRRFNKLRYSVVIIFN